MATLTSAEVKYGAPLVTKLGGVTFTATTIELPTGEYPEKGFELNLAKLGLTDESILGANELAPQGAAGEVASTTALPIAAWSTPLQNAKKAAENELQTIVFPTSVTLGKGKLFLRIFAQETAGKKGPLVEPATADKAVVTLCSATVFVLGK